MSGTAITITLGLIAIATILAIVLPVVFSALNGKFSIKSVIGMVALIVIVGIIYALSPGEISQVFQTSKYSFVDTGLMKYVETGINSSLLLLVIAFGGWIVLELVNFVRNLT